MSAERERLAPRRPALTQSIEFVKPGGSSAVYDASVGFDERVWPKEIFLSGAREGSEMQAVLADASVIVSVALQHGVTAAALARSLSRVPVPSEDDEARTAPASVIGAALELLVRVERERSAVAVQSGEALP